MSQDKKRDNPINSRSGGRPNREEFASRRTDRKTESGGTRAATAVTDRPAEKRKTPRQPAKAAIPAWASQSAANLYACGIVGEGIDGSEALTRGDASEMLYAAAQILGNR